MDYSIVIPTWNRSELVDRLLKSLYFERNHYKQGNTEVLVIDSSENEEKSRILKSCADYDAIYIEGEDSVRKKRNKGIRAAKYNTILFIDSDVEVMPGILDEYVKAYGKQYHAKLGGVLGFTEFVGEKSFWWRILERTSMVDSFSFARNYPFHSWTIGNNVSFKKCVLEEVGLFEEDFPFKLGGDDLDLTYRVTKAGYLIASAPDAVTHHSRETWNSFKAVHDRAKRWGLMESRIAQRHPELVHRVIPKNWVLMSAVMLYSGAISTAIRTKTPMRVSGAWLLMNWILDYVLECKNHGLCSPVCFAGVKIVGMMYEYYRMLGSLELRTINALTEGLVFNRFQIKFGMKQEAERVWKLLTTFIPAAAVVLSTASNSRR